MYDKLTKKDIEKMEQEVEHRKLVCAKKHWKMSKRRGRMAT